MKRIIVSISTIIALALPALASAALWNIDPDHSNVGFKVRHLMVSNVKGSFDKHAGTVDINDKDITKSKVEVTIDTTSVNSGTAAFDKHLQSADFFDAAKFPMASFKSTSVKPAGLNKFTVVGNLTIKDISKPVTLAVTMNGAGKHPMAGKQAIGFTATASIKRSDFGVGAYAPTVSDEVHLRITTEGMLADAATTAK